MTKSLTIKQKNIIRYQAGILSESEFVDTVEWTIGMVMGTESWDEYNPSERTHTLIWTDEGETMVCIPSFLSEDNIAHALKGWLKDAQIEEFCNEGGNLLVVDQQEYNNITNSTEYYDIPFVNLTLHEFCKKVQSKYQHND